MKKALLIGINSYPAQPLQGCVNDVTAAAKYLTGRKSFATEDVRLVTDDRATTAAIRERLAWLVDGAVAGDTLYLHYSGHGTMFPVRDAHGKVTETHSAICPVDFDWTREHALFDEDLRESVNRVTDGVEFVFVSDSCHSGDLTRASRRNRPRFFFPPADIAWRMRAAREKGLKPQLLAVHDRCALISGCRADQTSEDAYIGDTFNGALTYYLMDRLRSAAGADEPLSSLVEAVRKTLADESYDQEPQLRGPDQLLARGFLATA